MHEAALFNCNIKKFPMGTEEDKVNRMERNFSVKWILGRKQSHLKKISNRKKLQWERKLRRAVIWFSTLAFNGPVKWTPHPNFFLLTWILVCDVISITSLVKYLRCLLHSVQAPTAEWNNVWCLHQLVYQHTIDFETGVQISKFSTMGYHTCTGRLKIPECWFGRFTSMMV